MSATTRMPIAQPLHSTAETTAKRPTLRSLELPPEGFARQPQVVHVVGFGKTTLWELVKSGRFPAPIKIPGTNATAWRVDDVRQWIADASIAANDATGGAQ